MAGFSTVGGKREGHKVLYADTHPKRPNKKAPITLGKTGQFDQQYFESIIKFLESAKINVQVEEDIDGWLKTHAAMILGIAGAAYKTEMDLQKITQLRIC